MPVEAEGNTSYDSCNNDQQNDLSKCEYQAGSEATLEVEENTPPLEMNDVLEREVLSFVKDINISKSSGLDNIGSHIVKVTFMYNLSINASIFPDDWKLVTVIPIPKTGNLTTVQNFRPISLLSLPGKIFEKLIHK